MGDLTGHWRRASLMVGETVGGANEACRKCGSTRRGPPRPCGKPGRCLDCASEITKRYRRTEQGKAKQVAWRKSEAYKQSRLIYRRLVAYGLTGEQQIELFESQMGLCAVCAERLVPGNGTHLDHDHAAGTARGFLCGRCNVAIGMLRDSSALADRAASYLRRHRR